MGFDEKIVNDVNGYSIKVKLPNGAYETLMGRLRAERTEVIESNNTRIHKVIFSGPATIVFWNDGSKTVVKCTKGDQLNYEMGIAMCALKKLFGDSYRYFKKDLKKWVPVEEKKSESKPWHIIVNTEDSKSIAAKPQEFADAFGEFLKTWNKGE